MTILSKIKILIDQLSDSPQNIDIDNIRNVLSMAYEVARDRLDRSKNDTDFKTTKELLSATSEELSKLKTESENLSKLKVLLPFFEDLKNKLIGKVNLIGSYDESYKESLVVEINSVTPENIVSVFNRVENDFNRDWGKVSKDKIVAKNSINLKHYSTGGV